MAMAGALAIAAAYNDPWSHTYLYDINKSPFPPGITAPDRYEALLGRKLTPTPPHLTSRILYLPSHNDEVTHLPIYEFTKEYKEAIKDEPIGSSRFKTTFGLMDKPAGDGRAGEVSYLVDFDPLEARRSSLPDSLQAPGVPGTGARGATIPGGRRKSSLGGPGRTRTVGAVTHATVRRRMLGAGAEVGLTIPPHPAPGTDVDEGAVAFTLTPNSSTTAAIIPAKTSFPVEPTMSKFGSSRNPWFTFTVPSLLLGCERTLQWQMHPVQHGMLRYTLVEIPSHEWWEDVEDGPGKKIPYSAAQDGDQHLVRAIYHNAGLGFSLSQPFSEGALLVQHDLDPELEAVVVASLLGVLWRARGEESKPRKGSKSDGGKTRTHSRKGSASADEAVSPTGQGRRSSRLFGKILGKR